MSGNDSVDVVPFFVAGVLFVGVMVVGVRHSARTWPANIVHRLLRTGGPVTFTAREVTLPIWDPSRPGGYDGFWNRGAVTYTLESPTRVHLRYVPRNGEVIERSGDIPNPLLPDPPELRRRKLIARTIVSAYAALGLASFIISAELASGTSSLRVRLGALTSVGAVTLAWLITHLVITHRRNNRPGSIPHPFLMRMRRVAAWLGGLLLISAVLAVAWRLGDTGQPGQTTTSWPSAFVNAGIFVFVCAAAVAASTHHHHYIHHTDTRADK